MLFPPAVAALNRFGLGARRGDTARIAADPRTALRAELNPSNALLTGDDLTPTSAAIGTLRQIQMARKEARATETPASAEAKPSRKPMMAGDAEMDGPRQIYLAEFAARLDRAATAEIGFVERLVAFWTNHFAVKAGAGQIERALVGAFEREAIRPNVLGRFADMLSAVTRHPAMLAYLNNAESVGPDSPAGKRRDRGLNENHARELMELHTLGVKGGYSQADVTAVANILTGWSFSGGRDGNEPGVFVFRISAHEPGPRTVIGKVYGQLGEQQGEALLADLGRASATATHIATKLARSFVADSPPPALVTKLADTFRSSDGDLKQLALALVDDDEAWQGPGKFRTPQQFLWSSRRALGVPIKPPAAARILSTLGQTLWDPPAPAGFDETAATWLAPDAMTGRLEAAEQLAAMADPTIDPATLLDDLFAGGASATTREAVARAESQRQGLSLLLMSPEFQRI
jgi:uncharacterized protein (DUF1800 family)